MGSSPRQKFLKGKKISIVTCERTPDLGTSRSMRVLLRSILGGEITCWHSRPSIRLARLLGEKNKLGMQKFGGSSPELCLRKSGERPRVSPRPTICRGSFDFQIIATQFKANQAT